MLIIIIIIIRIKLWEYGRGTSLMDSLIALD